MKLHKSYLCILFCLLSIHAVAQTRADNWFFGRYASISFQNNTAVSLTDGSLNSWEGCSSISDREGNLLFYTDGVSIYDTTHAVMPNGDSLKGHWTSTQSSIIIPIPGNDDLFYVFTVDGPDVFTPGHGLHYSIVDMKRNGGKGNVKASWKNVLLDSNVAEKITAVNHCNGGDVWILTHGWNSNQFKAYLLTNSGLITTPVVSTIGSIHSGHHRNGIGNMKFSPNGKRVALVKQGPHSGSNAERNSIELFHFDNATGVVHSLSMLSIPANQSAYGLEFSPSGNKMYVSGNIPTASIYQFDLSPTNPVPVQSTRVKITSSGQYFGAMQLGPDGKIYVDVARKSTLSCINNPELNGTACGYNRFALTLQAGSDTKLGLPNFNQSFLVTDNQEFTAKGSCFGDSMKFALVKQDQIDSVFWKFNDPFSTNDTSRALSPGYKYTQPGLYDVNVSVFVKGCNRPFNMSKEVVVDKHPYAVLTDTTICNDDTIRLTADSVIGRSFLWSTGRTKTHTPASEGGNYWFKTSNECGEYTARQSISIHEELSLDLGSDLQLCTDDSITLDATQNSVKYLWHNGSNNSTFSTNEPGVYWVRVKGQCETLIDSVEFYQYNPQIDLGNDTIICVGETLEINAALSHPSTIYHWQNGHKGPSMSIDESGRYWLAVKQGCETAQDTIKVIVMQDPFIEVPEEVLKCGNKNAVVTPHVIAFKDYVLRWSDGSSGDQFKTKDPGTYTVQVQDRCGAKLDTFVVNAIDFPSVNLGGDHVLCAGDSMVLNAGGEHITQYTWSTGSSLDNIVISEPGRYDVMVANECGVARDWTYVTMEECDCNFYLPNTFTPDGDGINDYFEAVYNCQLLEFDIKIFNRWGAQMYASENPDFRWDGRTSKIYEEDEVFVYLIDLEVMDKGVPTKRKISGTITVLR